MCLKENSASTLDGDQTLEFKGAPSGAREAVGCFLRRTTVTGIPMQISQAVDVLRKFFEPMLRLR